MAKVQIKDDSVDIQVSLLERVMLAERPRSVPLSRIRSVDPHPPLLDMMMHWSDQSGVWLCGVSAYDGHMVPSARHPGNTLAIELDGEDAERIYIEVDDESPLQAAERITRARTCAEDRTTEAFMATDHVTNTASDVPLARPDGPLDQRALLKALDVEYEEDDDVQLRDPLMQGSLPAPPMYGTSSHTELAPELQRSDDRDLSRLGSWLVGVGSLGLLAGGLMLASGALPGLLAVGAGVTCAALGGIALAVVAHHQS
jgi:hypothetical protein